MPGVFQISFKEWTAWYDGTIWDSRCAIQVLILHPECFIAVLQESDLKIPLFAQFEDN